MSRVRFKKYYNIILIFMLLLFFGCNNINHENYDLQYGSACDSLAFSHESGFYSQGFYLDIKSLNPKATILYTLDGSEPTIDNLNGRKYPLYTQYFYNHYQKSYIVAPIKYIWDLISKEKGERPTFKEFVNYLFIKHKERDYKYVKTNIYSNSLFIDTLSAPVLSNIPTSINFPKSPVDSVPRAIVVKACALGSDKIYTKTFFVGLDYFKDNQLPIVSLIFNEEDFFSRKNGFYVPGDNDNAYKRGKEWEREIIMQIFDVDGAHPSQRIGVRVHGSFSRGFAFKSLRVYARKKYDDKFIKYNFFEDDKKQKRLIIRAAGNDQPYSYIRHSLVSELMKNSKVETEKQRAVNLFFNGEYWGVAFVQERIDESFLAMDVGTKKKNIELIKLKNENVDNYVKTKPFMFELLLDSLIGDSLFIKKLNDFNSFQNELDFSTVIDKTIADIFLQSEDVHHKLWRNSKDPESKWKYILWDMDISMLSPVIPPPHWFDTVSISNNFLPYTLTSGSFLSLLPKEDYQEKLLSRYATLLGSYLSAKNINFTIDSLANILHQSMPYHINRWRKIDGIESVEKWEKEIEILHFFANQRKKYVYKQACEHFSKEDTVTIRIHNSSFATIYVEDIALNELIFYSRQDNFDVWQAPYFIGIPVHLKVVPKYTDKFTGWYLNGELVSIEEEFILIPQNKNISVVCN